MARDTLKVGRDRSRARALRDRVDDLNSSFKKTSNACIVFHIYYEDIVGQIISEYLEPISQDVDVIVTIHEAASIETIGELHRCLPNIYINISENRGRDILPFFEILPFLMERNYRIGCKIHTKKSLHRIDGDEMRVHALDSLLKVPGGISEIMQAFSEKDDLGLIIPPYSLLDLADPKFHMDNVLWLDKLLLRMGETEKIGRYAFYFPAGSMYWFRVRALTGLLADGFINLEEFENESGQFDGCLHHTVERIITLLIEKSGYKMGIVLPYIDLALK